MNKIKGIIRPKAWEHWRFEQAQSQKLTDYMTLDDYLFNKLGPPKVSAALNNNKLNKTSEAGCKRQKSIKARLEFLPIIWSISLGLFLTLPIMSYFEDKMSSALYSSAFPVLLIATLGAVFMGGLLGRQLNQLLSTRTERPLEYYAFKQYTDHVKAIDQLLVKMRDAMLDVYTLEANGTIKKVMNNYWALDYAKLGLITSQKVRRSIALLGDPPSGETLFLKSDLKNLKIPDYVQESSPKKPFNRNSRTDIHLQGDALGTQANIKKLIKLINKKHPLISEGERSGLEIGNIVRIEAIEYISKKKKFWSEDSLISI